MDNLTRQSDKQLILLLNEQNERIKRTLRNSVEILNKTLKKNYCLNEFSDMIEFMKALKDQSVFLDAGENYIFMVNDDLDKRVCRHAQLYRKVINSPAFVLRGSIYICGDCIYSPNERDFCRFKNDVIEANDLTSLILSYKHFAQKK